MTRLAAAVEAAAQVSNQLEPVARPDNPQQRIATPPIFVPWLMMNPFLRAPLPAIASSPDSLRQFYGGAVPLTRIVPIKQ